MVERFNHTIEQKTTSLLADSGFPTFFWGFAIGAAQHIYNRIPHLSINYELTITRWEGKLPETHSFALFGAAAY